jgi:ferredoxin
MSADRKYNPAAWIENRVKQFVSQSPENDLGLAGGEPAFANPLVGFACGDDPLWEEYKAHIGAFYLTPQQVFELAFPGQAPVQPRELTVLCWILPSTAATRSEQSTRTRRPSERWARTRYHGERFNECLRRHVVAVLESAGIAAAAPVLSSFWSRMDSGPFRPCSNWSERHAAFAAGLGTFGLCDGLITPVGKAVRIGSVVARIVIPPTPRPYNDRHAYCLHFSHGTCGKCIERCPVKALSRDGHDKSRCMAYTENVMHAYMIEKFGIQTYACGLCQAAVPCMDHIPAPTEG